MDVGLVIPAMGEAGFPLPTWREIRELAGAAEAVGLASLWVVDHLLVRGDRWLESDPSVIEVRPRDDEIFGTHECWTLLAGLAAITDRVKIGTLVSCMGFRNAALLAKMASTVDEMSGGRLILGLGAGDLPDEFRMFGYPTDHPIGRFEESLQITLPLLRTGRVDFEGQYHVARDTELRPRGPRAEGPPIMIGAVGTRTGSRMMRIVAQYADLWTAWVVWRDNRPSVVPPLRAAVDAACHLHGRDPSSLGRTLAIGIASMGGPVDNETYISGPPEAVAERLAGFAAEGISHVQARVYPTTTATVEELGRAARLLEM